MFELKSYEKFRDTEDVRFFDISINSSNFRDLVIHKGPAVSPPNEKELGLSNAIDKIIVNQELRLNLSKNSILLRKKYSISNIIQKWNNILDI